MGKKIKIAILIFSIALISMVCYFFLAKAPQKEHITWGVNFSQEQAEALNLDWKKVYLATLEDLKVKHVKLITNWDFIEEEKDRYYFKDVDWQLDQAARYDAKILYVVGMKTGRWPECHVPQWAQNLSKQEQQDRILQYLTITIERYKNNKTIAYWHIENEPLVNFGECPWRDKDFLKKEIALVRSLDPSRSIIVSDSGELSLWFDTAGLGDILGTTMYRKVRVAVTNTYGFYWTYPFPPITYWLKAEIISALFHKKVICIELQTEPWTSTFFSDVPLQEQEKTMNISQFQKNINYAKETGFDEFYLWGTEWWYWLKEVHAKPEIWNEAKKLFQ